MRRTRCCRCEAVRPGALAWEECSAKAASKSTAQRRVPSEVPGRPSEIAQWPAPRSVSGPGHILGHIVPRTGAKPHDPTTLLRAVNAGFSTTREAAE